jgi:hypothetical protein
MAKRKITLKAENVGRMVEILEKLGELDIDLDAEGRPGTITVVVQGSKEQVRQSIAKIRKLLK